MTKPLCPKCGQEPKYQFQLATNGRCETCAWAEVMALQPCGEVQAFGHEGYDEAPPSETVCNLLPGHDGQHMHVSANWPSAAPALEGAG